MIPTQIQNAPISTARLSRNAKTPQQARQIVTEWLGDDDELLPDVLLVMVEMITNAVQHVEAGEGRDWVTLNVLRYQGFVRTEVIDPGSGISSPEALNDAPRAAPAPPSVELRRGRGLHIVRVCSGGRCGTYVNDKGHRVVWAELPYPRM